MDGVMNQTLDGVARRLREQLDEINSQILWDVISAHGAERRLAEDIWRRYRIKPAKSMHEGPGVRILAREPISDSDPNQRLPHAFERKIVKNKRGYMRGVTIGTEQEEAADAVQEWLQRENIPRLIGTTIARAALFGRAYWLLFIGRDDNRVRVRLSEPFETVVIRDEAGDVQYAFRYWDMEVVDQDGNRQSRKHIEAYDRLRLRKYTEDERGMFRLDEDGDAPHFFTEVPVIEFKNDDEAIGHIEPVMPLIDAYNIAVSDFSSEVTAMRLAYLVQEIREGYTEPSDIDEEFVETLQKTGILQGSWRFLEKNIQDAAIQNLITMLRKSIYEFADSYDPDEMAEGDPTAFQIAQKLKSLEDAAVDTEEQFTEAIGNVFRVASTFWSPQGLSIDPGQITQSYPRNIPRNRDNEVKTIVSGGGRISNRTLLETSSIIEDVDQEIERLEEEDESRPPSIMDDERDEEQIPED